MLDPGTKVRLPDGEPARKGGKPEPRFATVVEPPFLLDGYLLVEKCDRAGRWWIRANIVQAETEP